MSQSYYFANLEHWGFCCCGFVFLFFVFLNLSYVDNKEKVYPLPLEEEEKFLKKSFKWIWDIFSTDWILSIV